MPGQTAGAIIGLDAGFLRTVYRPHVVAGRLPRRGATDEVVVNEALAKRGGVRVGDRVRLRSGFDRPFVDLGSATVVGITRGIFDVGVNSTNAVLLLNSEFFDAHRESIQVGPQPALIARLTDDAAGFDDYRRALRATTGSADVQTGGGEARATDRTLRVQTYGYALLAAVVLLALGVAVAQALSRVLSSALVDLPTLVSMGFRPEQRVALGIWLVAPVAIIGALTGVAVAVVASPLIPTGFARSVDPTDGVHVDALVAVALGALWVVGVGAIGSVLAWRERPGRAMPRARRVNRVFASMPLRPRLGGQAALAPGRGPAGVAARSSLVGVAVGLAGIVAVVVFATSLGYLFDHPRVEGWTFDAAISSSEHSLDELRASLSELPRDDAVADVAWASVVELRLGGRPVETYAFTTGSTLHPALRSGRAPARAGEVALGRDTSARSRSRSGRQRGREGARWSRSPPCRGVRRVPRAREQRRCRQRRLDHARDSRATRRPVRERAWARPHGRRARRVRARPLRAAER